MLLRTVFLKAIRDHRKGIIWWSVGLAALMAYTMSFYTTLQTSMAGYAEMMENLPETFKAMFGAEGGWDLGSPAGYLRIYMFSMIVPLMFIILAVSAGSDAGAGEEERGTLDLLLAGPLPRWQYLLERAAAVFAFAGVVALVTWATLYIMAQVVGMPIGGGHLAAAVVSAALLGLAFGALALAISAVSGNKGLGTGVAVALGVAGYVLQSMSSLSAGLEPYRVLSPWYYYAAADPLRNGLNPGHAALLAAIAVIGLAVALVGFQRRDLSV